MDNSEEVIMIYAMNLFDDWYPNQVKPVCVTDSNDQMSVVIIY